MSASATQGGLKNQGDDVREFKIDSNARSARAAVVTSYMSLVVVVYWFVGVA